MPRFVSKDYHIELMSLFEFANNCLSTGTISVKAGQQLHDIFKRAVLGAEIKPLIALSDKTSNLNSYEKYYQLAHEVNGSMLPEVFEYYGNLYDLNIILNISKDHIYYDDFKMLFLLKVSEIEFSNTLFLEEFLHFQLFDNFFGDPETFDSFCHHLTANDGFCQLSSFSMKTIITWFDKYSNNTDRNLVDKEEIRKENTIFKETDIDETEDNSIEKNTIAFTENHDNDNNTSIENNDATKSFVLTEPYEIKGRFTIEQICHYFSFLYKEKSCNKQPFLKEEEVEIMFQNGLVIPVEPPNVKFKLNYDPRFPKKIVDYAIYLFFTSNSFTQRDKANYFRFFGSYLEDYQDAVSTPKGLEYITSNIRGNRSRREKFKIEKYLPQ